VLFVYISARKSKICGSGEWEKVTILKIYMGECVER